MERGKQGGERGGSTQQGPAGVGWRPWGHRCVRASPDPQGIHGGGHPGVLQAPSPRKPPEQQGPSQHHQCHPNATPVPHPCPPRAPAEAPTLNVCFLLMLSEGCTAATRKLSRGMLPRMFSSFSSGEGGGESCGYTLGGTPGTAPPPLIPRLRPTCGIASPPRLLLLPQPGSQTTSSIIDAGPGPSPGAAREAGKARD